MVKTCPCIAETVPPKLSRVVPAVPAPLRAADAWETPLRTHLASGTAQIHSELIALGTNRSGLKTSKHTNSMDTEIRFIQCLGPPILCVKLEGLLDYPRGIHLFHTPNKQLVLTAHTARGSWRAASLSCLPPEEPGPGFQPGECICFVDTG